MTARIAFSAYHLRLNGYLLTNGKTLYIFAELYNLAGYFVSLCHGVAGKWVLSVINMDVRTTDAYSFDFYKHLLRRDFGNGNLTKSDFLGICHYLL